MEKKIKKPINQKTVYHSFADLYEKIMNDEIPIEKAVAANAALCGMNRAFSNEIKLSELRNKKEIRHIESKDFE
ncbi:MAG: hypothetical protein NT079_04360 [Candidatus Omnitrophica bacterium]|nr:hypothetical protein [Candidatus Omnitrophota bacterium]